MSQVEWDMSPDDADLTTLLREETFANLRGCEPRSLASARKAGRIFYLVVQGVPMYPAFYVDRRLDQPRLERITKVLKALPDGSKWQFFTTAKGSLGSVTPLGALLAGRYDDVRASATAFAER